METMESELTIFWSYLMKQDSNSKITITEQILRCVGIKGKDVNEMVSNFITHLDRFNIDYSLKQYTNLTMNISDFKKSISYLDSEASQIILSIYREKQKLFVEQILRKTPNIND